MLNNKLAWAITTKIDENWIEKWQEKERDCREQDQKNEIKDYKKTGNKKSNWPKNKRKKLWQEERKPTRKRTETDWQNEEKWQATTTKTTSDVKLKKPKEDWLTRTRTKARTKRI